MKLKKCLYIQTQKITLQNMFFLVSFLNVFLKLVIDNTAWQLQAHQRSIKKCSKTKFSLIYIMLRLNLVDANIYYIILEKTFFDQPNFFIRHQVRVFKCLRRGLPELPIQPGLSEDKVELIRQTRLGWLFLQ
jgi:hypothetical protein